MSKQKQPSLTSGQQLNCISNIASSSKGPSISQNPAFKYFKSKDQLIKTKSYQSSRSQEVEEVELRECDRSKSLSQHQYILDELKSGGKSDGPIEDNCVSNRNNLQGVAASNSCVFVPSTTVTTCITTDNVACSIKSNSMTTKATPTLGRKKFFSSAIIRSSSNDSNSSTSDTKNQLVTSKLVKQQSEENPPPQWRRGSGHDRYKWFFRSLRGERGSKVVEGTVSGNVQSFASCSSCQLAQLSVCQLEQRVKELELALADKSTNIDGLTSDLAEKKKSVEELSSKIGQVLCENDELKKTINKLVSEQKFGQKLLLAPCSEETNLKFSPLILGSKKLSYSTSMSTRGQAPHQTFLGACQGSGPKPLCTYGDRTDSDNAPCRNNVQNGPSSSFPIYFRDGDDYVGGINNAGLLVVPDGNRMAYQTLAVEQKLQHEGDLKSHVRTRKTNHLTTTDREWHSTEGFGPMVNVGRVDASMAAAASAVEARAGNAKREAKSSLELDDSLCVEYPNRTFRQQMESLKGVRQSVDSLKSESTGRGVKSRRRRETVASIAVKNAMGGGESTKSESCYPVSRKLSNYLLEEQQLRVHKTKDSTTEVSQFGQLVKACSSDPLYLSPEEAHSKRQPQNHLQQNQQRHYQYNIPIHRTSQGNDFINLDTRHPYSQTRDYNNNNSNFNDFHHQDQIKELAERLELLYFEREAERKNWLREKVKVIEYQKKLQNAILSVSAQCRSLEDELSQSKKHS